MTAEHNEQEATVKRPAADVAVDIMTHLSTTDALGAHPELAALFGDFLADFNAIHTDGREWDRRVLVDRFDRLVMNILQATTSILQPEQGDPE